MIVLTIVTGVPGIKFNYLSAVDILYDWGIAWRDVHLQVQLKRKHWAHQEGGTGAGDASTSRASQRLTKIFQSQLASAQQRLAGAPAHAHGSRTNKKQRASQGRPAPSPGPATNPLLQAQATKAREERERLRASVVAAYRNSKKGSEPGPGNKSVGGMASMASLAKLVQRGKSMEEAARIR